MADETKDYILNEPNEARVDEVHLVKDGEAKSLTKDQVKRLHDAGVKLKEAEGQSDGDDQSDTDYSDLTVPQLQELLGSRDLPTTGTKDELIARLNEADDDEESV